jgi:hypothetical protein
MKKLAIMALAVFTLTGFAQNRSKENNKALNERLTKRLSQSPENRSKLETKQMALKLDLTQAQQLKVEEALLAHYDELEKKGKLDKKAIQEMTDKQRQEIRLNRLDNAIALKEEMKAILDEAQYAKYSEMLENRGKRMAQRRRQ